MQLVSDRQVEEKRAPSRGPHRLDQAKSNRQMDFSTGANYGVTARCRLGANK